jgi:Holliday junction resolvasome RuvABC endonuclease subunit
MVSKWVHKRELLELSLRALLKKRLPRICQTVRETQMKYKFNVSALHKSFESSNHTCTQLLEGDCYQKIFNKNPFGNEF